MRSRTPILRPFIRWVSPGSRPDPAPVYNTRTSGSQRSPERSVPEYHWWRTTGGNALSQRHRDRGVTKKFIVLVGLLVLLALCNSSPAAVKKSRRPGRVQTGIDVLEAEKFAPLRGKHVGLITNHTGLDTLGRSTIELFFHAPGLQLVALFSPEHGISG